MRKYSVVAVFMLVAFLAVPLTGRAEEAKKPSGPLKVGDIMTDFTLQSLGGKEVSYARDLKGKTDVTVLVLMNTACSSCRMEMKAMEGIGKKYKGKVAIYAVSVDMKGKDVVEEYQKKWNFSGIDYLLDPEFTIGPKFGFSYTPSVVICDKEGKLLFLKGGFSPGDEDLIAEKLMSFIKG